MEPRSQSDLVERQRALGRLRDSLFVQRRRLGRQLEGLTPTQQDEAAVISSEIGQVVWEFERTDAEISQIQYRLGNRTETESGGDERTVDDVDGSGKPAAETRQQRKLEWLAKAMILVQENPDWPDVVIAQKVGRNPSQLSRSKSYQTVAAGFRGDKSSIVSGFIVKDDDTGTLDVEAYSDDPTEPDIYE